MKKTALNMLAVLMSAAALSYAGDYLFWRYKASTDHNAYATVTVQFYYAIQEKRKTERLSTTFRLRSRKPALIHYSRMRDIRPAGMSGDIQKSRSASEPENGLCVGAARSAGLGIHVVR
jgi:hypothetical protein